MEQKKVALALRVEEIDSLQHVNGVSIAEIERRGRPVRYDENKEMIRDKVPLQFFSFLFFSLFLLPNMQFERKKWL